MTTIEDFIRQQVGIKPGANDLTPMDYLECKTIAQKYADLKVKEALDSQWVSVKDRLPKFNINVLGATNQGKVVITFAESDGQLSTMDIECHYKGDTERFTHWAPLPSPPKQI